MKTKKLKCPDLRIGNWVKVNDPIFGVNTYKVATIRDNGIITLSDNISCLFDNIEPIELTEELLVKIGFKKNKYDWWEYYPSREDEISIRMTDNYTTIEYANLFHCPEDVTEVNYGSTLEFPRRIYIHQLQNAYYCLTNKELEVKL